MIKCNIYLTFNHPKTIAPKNSKIFFGGGQPRMTGPPKKLKKNLKKQHIVLEVLCGDMNNFELDKFQLQKHL